MIRSCSIRLDGIRTGSRTLFAAHCNHLVQIDLWTTTPKFVLHPTDRHLGGSVRSVSLVAAVNRSRIGTEEKSVSIIGIRHIHSEPNRAHSDSATFGKTSRFCPSSYRSQFEQVQHTYIRNRTDSGSNPTRTTSGEPTGCTPTQFVVDSEPSQSNQNRIRWPQHPAHRK